MAGLMPSLNNAAIMYDSDAFGVTANLDGVHKGFETNLFGAWRMIQAFLPLLRIGRHPRIVNVSSEGGSLSSMSAGTPTYSTSKAALNALTRIIAAEVHDAGILVNAVCPGWTATEMGGSGGRPVKDGAASITWGVVIFQRQTEAVGTADTGIILFRKTLERELRKVEAGQDPMNVFRDPAQRGC